MKGYEEAIPVMAEGRGKIENDGRENFDTDNSRQRL
jgi:hypothetical protein